MIDFARVTESEGKDCKGQIYKAEVRRYKDKNGRLCFRTRLIPQKRLSCPGCLGCPHLEDDFQEGVNIWNVENAEDGKLYRLGIANIHTDWETGIVDDWDLKLEEVKQ